MIRGVLVCAAAPATTRLCEQLGRIADEDHPRQSTCVMLPADARRSGIVIMQAVSETRIPQRVAASFHACPEVAGPQAHQCGVYDALGATG